MIFIILDGPAFWYFFGLRSQFFYFRQNKRKSQKNQSIQKTLKTAAPNRPPPRTGYGAELERTAPAQLPRATVVNDLPAAADWILNELR